MDEVQPQEIAAEISWQAPDFERAERSSRWYLWSIMITLGLVLIALLQRNILFAIFVVVAEIVILFLGHEHPKVRLYSANEEGIFLDHEPFKTYTDISSFAFFDLGLQKRYVELILRPRKKLQAYIRLLIPRERVEETAAFLATYLETFHYEGTFADVIAKHLGI